MMSGSKTNSELILALARNAMKATPHGGPKLRGDTSQGAHLFLGQPRQLHGQRVVFEAAAALLAACVQDPCKQAQSASCSSEQNGLRRCLTRDHNDYDAPGIEEKHNEDANSGAAHTHTEQAALT
jgi:hypothetical protein